MGDIILQCSGSTPSAALTGNLTVYLPIPITDRINANNQSANSTLSVDFGSGFANTGISGQVSSGAIAFNGLNLTFPASGNMNLKVSGIRAAVNSTPAGQPISALLSLNVVMDRSQVIVAYPQPGLLTTLYQTGIPCVGSPLPSTISVGNLLSTTAFASTRLTEGFGGAFLPRGSGDDMGTRFVVNYSGFPAQSQLYVPDFVAGSDAAVPSMAGDLGGTATVGQYVPGSGTLLLARVLYADSSGNGGQVSYLPAGSGTLTLGSASPVSLNNGAGYAVYEVIDANPNLIESVQFPTFFGIPKVTAAATAQETVMLGPISTANAASQSAAIPRFAASTPGSDCSQVGDCGANYFPRLSVSSAPMLLKAYASGGPMISGPGYAPIQNAGGGILNYNVSINYQSGGTGWLKQWPNPNSVEVTAITTNLQPGTYNANIVVDAGQAGSVTIPVTLTVVAAPPPPGPSTPPAPTTPPAPVTPTVVVTSVVNAATFQPTPLVAGSLGTVMGTGFGGKSVAVTFDGVAATVLYVNATQINLQVPASLPASKTSSSLVVTVDGASSAAVPVSLAPAAPAVFANGVLNQDNTINSAASKAKVGDILQIFATGIPANAAVTVQIGNQGNLQPLYAAAAPNFSGLQQVNVAVPGGVSGATPLTVCASTGGQSYCSSATSVMVQ